MADPVTPNLQLYIPALGSDVGSWNLPVNADFSAVDSLFTNNAAITLSNAPVTLSTPPNSGALWNGPYQSQSALISLSGALSADVQVIFPRAGYFIVQNNCTNTGAYYVQLVSGGAGNAIGAPPGKKCHVFNDGTNMDYVNMPDVGTAYDLHGATAIPPWMLACTVAPYLIKDGSVYNNTAYPALAALLGTTFGGTPGFTFAVPDELSRARVGFDTVGTNRLTQAIAGIIGTEMGSYGGDQNPQVHAHTATAASTDSGHTNPAARGAFVETGTGSFGLASGGNAFTSDGSTGIGKANITTRVTVNNAFSGASGNVQPTIVSFLPLVKT